MFTQKQHEPKKQASKSQTLYNFGRRGIYAICVFILILLLPSILGRLIYFDITNFNDLMLNVFVWLILLCVFFFIFLFLGDPSEVYQKYFKQYRAIWLTFSLVLLGTALLGFQGYKAVQLRVEADSSNETLARKTGLELKDTADKITCALPDLHYFLCSTESITDTAKLERYLKLHIVQANNQAAVTVKHFDLAVEQLETLVNIPGSVITSTQSLSDTIPAYLQIQELLTATLETAEELSRTLPLTDSDNNRLITLAYDLDNKATVAADSLVSVYFDGLSMLLWLGWLYVALVLFPWVLLLLFMFGNRSNRTMQIWRDLKRLGLLEEAMSESTDTTAGDEQDEQKEPDEQKKTDEQKELDKQKKLELKKLDERAFSNAEYILNLLFLSLILALGWYYIFYPQASTGLAYLIWRRTTGIEEFSQVILTNLTPLTMGFVGAYFFSIQFLVRRYLVNDLYPSAFLQIIQRFLLVFMLSLVLNFMQTFEITFEFTENPLAKSFNDIYKNTYIVIAFIAGIFPKWGLRLIVDSALKRINSKKKFSELRDVPLTKLDGITIWDEERLLQRGIENIQSLATAPIHRLVIGTPYPTTRIVDWIDQAILYSHTGHSRGDDNPNYFQQLRAVGIRTAYDLLDAARQELLTLDAQLKGQDFEACPEQLEKIAVAINQAYGHQPASADSNPGQNPKQHEVAPAPDIAEQTTGNKSASTSANSNLLTAEILDIICMAIWPDPNIPYIVLFYEETLTEVYQINETRSQLKRKDEQYHFVPTTD